MTDMTALSGKSPPIKAIAFDVGNVIVPWDPRRAYAPLFHDRPDELDHFLNNICTLEWHTRHDRGVPFADNIHDLQQQYPAYAEMIAAFETEWDNMFGEIIEGTVALLRRLHSRGYPLYALTNFAADKFARFREQHDFMSLFRDAIVSGAEKVTKPDPKIYQILLKRTGLPAENILFIDDRQENLDAAERLGLRTILFRDADQLASELSRRGIIQG